MSRPPFCIAQEPGRLLDVQIINPLSFPGWDDQILKFEEASIFHSSSWARLLSDSYRFKPRYVISHDKGELRAVIPMMEVRNLQGEKKGVSLPFSDYCFPLFTDEAAFERAFDFALDSARINKWKSLTLCGNAPFRKEIPPSTFYYRHVLRLGTDEKKQFGLFRENTKRNITKAIKENINVSFETSWEAVNEFYRLNCLTRKRHGLPPQPILFFKNLHKSVITQGKGSVAIGRLQGRPITASVFLHYGNKVFYKYGASNEQFNDTRGNYLVMWEAIRRYGDQGFETLCLGKTEVQHKGLLQYKTGWRAEQLIINNYSYDMRQGAFVVLNPRISGIFHNIFRRLPIPILRMIGSLSYKYMG